jgi:flagellar basal body-associated protein FliL
VALSGRKVNASDQTILIYLILAGIILLVAALILGLFWFLSTPQTIKEEAVPLIDQSTPGYDQPAPQQASVPNFPYWPPPEGYYQSAAQPPYFAQALPPGQWFPNPPPA